MGERADPGDPTAGPESVSVISRIRVNTLAELRSHEINDCRRRAVNQELLLHIRSLPNIYNNNDDNCITRARGW